MKKSDLKDGKVLVTDGTIGGGIIGPHDLTQGFEPSPKKARK